MYGQQINRPPEFGPYLNVKNAVSPAFSAGGERVLFLSDITGTNQVWSVSTGKEGGWPDQLTYFEERVTHLYPNPDGTAFIISRDRGGDEQDQFYLLEGDVRTGITVTTLLDTPKFKNNFGAWRSDGKAYCFSSNRRHPSYFDIYTQMLDGEPRLIYQADATLYPLDWSKDGRFILFRRSNTNLDHDLFLLDLFENSSQPRHLTPHEGQASFNGSIFTPDGRGVITISDLGQNFTNPARIDLSTNKLSYLSNRSRDCDALSLSPDGSRLAYEINEEGFSRLFVRDLGTEQEREISGFPKGIVLGIGLWQSNPVWSPDGNFLAFSFNSPIHNADVWLLNFQTEELRQLTYSPRGGLNFNSFVEPETVTYPTFDGLKIPALLFKPVGSNQDSTTPFILLVHGGPESQTRLSWNPVIQYYVARGYGVLAPNVRGSSGYGKDYLALDDIRKRKDSVADLKTAVEWLCKEGYSDPARIAVYGQSYGGFMVLMAVTTYPELWAAGVDIYGIANMLTFMENTSPYRLKQRTPEYGDPVTDRDFMIEISAIHKIDLIKAPMMVIHGQRDPRVPIEESEQLVEGLRKRNHPVEYLVMEDEGHGITKLKNKLRIYPAVADFLDKNLK